VLTVIDVRLEGMMTLEDEFEKRLRDAVRSSIALGYNPTLFADMLKSWGGVGVARRLIASGEIQYGFKKIVAMGHPELSMESIMLEPQFVPLFTAGELEAARWRLKQLA
jgi:hypothetical protein